MSCINKPWAHLWSSLTFPPGFCSSFVLAVSPEGNQSVTNPLRLCVVLHKAIITFFAKWGREKHTFLMAEMSSIPCRGLLLFQLKHGICSQKGRGAGLWRGCLLIGRSSEAKMFQRCKDNSLPSMWHESNACSLSFVTNRLLLEVWSNRDELRTNLWRMKHHAIPAESRKKKIYSFLTLSIAKLTINK